jgi:hypothetical protein
LIVILVGQPLISRRTGLTNEVLDGTLGLTYLAVLFAVFGERRRRTIAAVLFLPTVAGHVALMPRLSASCPSSPCAFISRRSSS